MTVTRLYWCKRTPYFCLAKILRMSFRNELSQVIHDNTVVAITYTLRERGPEGQVLETVDRQYPLRFLYGSSRLLPAFEAQLREKKVGDSFAFTLSPAEAYGPYQSSEVIDVPIEVFTNSQEELREYVHVGYYLTLTSADGQQRNGKVLAVGGESVQMDFNHAMAGKSLYFEGRVIEARQATAEEIALGQPIVG